MSAASKTRSGLLGPLTTIFVPPEICSQLFVRGNEHDVAWRGQTCASRPFGNAFPDEEYLPIDATECWPTATITPSILPFSGFGFYSPGLVCPQGMITACAASRVSDGITNLPGIPSFNFQFSLSSGETAFGCCPSSMVCGMDHGCQTCFQTTFNVVTTLASCYFSDVIPTPYSTSAAGYYAPLIQINRKAKDVSMSISSANSDDGRSTTPVTIGAASTSQKTTGEADKPVSNTGNGNETILTEDAKIAIGIGVAAALGLMLGVLYFLLHKRRTRFRETSSANRQEMAQQPGISMNSEPGVAVD